MGTARARATVAVVTVIALGGGAVGCGSSSPSSSSSATTSTSSSGRSPRTVVPSARRLEHALLAARVTPALSGASCRLETAGQRAGSPFGSTGPPVYACALRRGGAPTAYDVQVLPNGCFVAERRRPGAAIYGCGV